MVAVGGRQVELHEDVVYVAFDGLGAYEELFGEAGGHCCIEALVARRWTPGTPLSPHFGTDSGFRGGRSARKSPDWPHRGQREGSMQQRHVEWVGDQAETHGAL